MSMSNRRGVRDHVLKLKSGAEVRGQILSMLNGRFLVRIRKEAGYDREEIPFGDVDLIVPDNTTEEG